MICSNCNQNTAVVFISKADEKGNKIEKGYCYKCAKRLGIDPLKKEDDDTPTNINTGHLNNLTSQIDKAIRDMMKSMEKQGFDKETLENMQMGFAIGNISEDPEDYEELKNLAEEDNNSTLPFGTRKNAKAAEKNQNKKKPNKKDKKRRGLNMFGTNLTDLARKGELDKVIGREREIQRVVQILNRRSKNNPCLIGEPGVGKTAIAHSLAIKIANGDVPAKLLNKEIYLLDMNSMVAGTQFRGQFEARIKQVIDESKSLKNIILVIDEVHTLVGAGESDHSTNAANILKPALSDGSIQLIGTTTLNEYRKFIEKDTALERRFQPVIIDEPSVSETISIIKGIKNYYEDYHRVIIPDDLIEKMVLASERYISDRFLPDKAIDVLDEACSNINLHNKKLYELAVLKTKLEEILEAKEEAAEADSTEDYKKAAELKMKECQLSEEIKEHESKLEPTVLTYEEIAKVIENWTKIPVNKITEEETHRLLSLEKTLHDKVIGQNEAVSAVSKAIRRNRAGLKSTNRPPSFIFVGPTGVGKTELAKSLAEEMFGNRDALIRIDMSEYMDSNSTSKLIGTPPGYIGYNDPGQLTEKVKRKPYSLVLLDEIEKAHPDIFNLLLQVLDDGRLTDSRGTTINFEHTIIIMTSNVGSTANLNSIGFGNVAQLRKDKILENMKSTFRPEFLNRVDEIICFDSLTTDELLKIVDLMIKDTQKILEEKNIKLELSDNAKHYLLEKGTDIKYGARPLRRAVQRYVEDELAELLLKQTLSYNKKVYIDTNNEELTFNVTELD